MTEVLLYLALSVIVLISTLAAFQIDMKEVAKSEKSPPARSQQVPAPASPAPAPAPKSVPSTSTPPAPRTL